ncbi:MAG: sialidase family protein [Gemmatimonadales bacterium]
MRPIVLLLLLAGCSRPDFTLEEVDFTGPAGSLAPSLVAHGEGAILSWTEPFEGGHRVRVAVRHAAGWGEPQTVVAHDSLFVNWADFPMVGVFPDGRWLAHWLEKTAPDTYAYHVMMAVSTDSGRTWSPPFRPHGDRSNTEHGFVAMAPMPDGLGAIWLDGRKAATDSQPAMTLRFTSIRSDGSATPDEEIDGMVCDCCQTGLAATTDGLVAVYRDRSPSEIRDVVVARRTAGGWTEPAKVHDDGWHYPGCPVNGPHAAARGDTVAVAWFTNANDTARVLVAFSTNAGATFAPPITVHYRRPLGRVDVLWLADGDAAVAWLEETDGDAGAMRIRRVSTTGRLGTSVTFAETEATRRAGFPRLVVVPEGVLAAWRGPGDDGAVHARLLRINH